LDNRNISVLGILTVSDSGVKKKTKARWATSKAVPVPNGVYSLYTARNIEANALLLVNQILAGQVLLALLQKQSRLSTLRENSQIFCP